MKRIAEPAQTTSEGIFTAISDKIKDMNLDIDSCIAVAADGASVNFGKNTGVLSRLHAKLPWLIQMHCVSHRLELALKDAFKDTFYAVEIDNLMMQLYYMYRRSVKKWNELKKTAEAFGEHVVKPSRAQGTRWIDHRRKALRALVQDYRCLVAQFQEQGSELRKDVPPGDRAKMRGYAKLMTSQHFVLYLASYQDLVEELAHLSLTLQDEKLPVSSVRANVEVTQANLKLMIERPGRNLRNVLNESSAGEDGVLQVHQTQLTSSIHDVESFHNNSKKTIQKITNCLTSRFANFTENEVLSAAEILDPANIPTQAEAQVTYGLKEVDLLVHHFEQLLLNKGCNIEEVEREWQRIKYDIARNHKQETFYQLWQKMLTEKHERYSNFLHLVRILLVCPVATAQVERQFSTIKRILGDWRLGLGVHTIEHLLRICSEGPEPAHFVPEPAVHRWRTSSVRSRRPHTFPYGQRTDTDSAAQPAHFEE